MAVDKEHPVWVLGLVGVAASALTAQGQYTVVDLIVGVSLLIILSNVEEVWSASWRFRLAFSAVAGLCSILIVGPFVNGLLVGLGAADGFLWEVTSGDGSEYYRLFWLDVVAAVSWSIVTAGAYLRLARRASA